MLPLFVVVIFISSTLVFLIQPMFARMVLPVLGGSPAVWNTAMLFYQAVLLAGYGYAHLATKWLGVRRQALLHAVVLLLPLAVLPIAVPEGWRPPAESDPGPWLLALFAVAIGLPYFVVTTSSPLLQRWFSAVGHQESGDPYFLYAASNIGSMLALLGYPFLVEPWLPTAAQGWLWSGGYLLLLLLMWGCVWGVWKRAPEGRRAPGTPSLLTGRRPGWAQVARWVALAFVPSSLMLSVTTTISTDLAAAPLLWVVPLSLYLLTFILVFGRRTARFTPVFDRAFAIAMVALVMVMAMGSTRPISLMIPLHLGVFFVIAMVCHGRMAAERPAPEHLTGFYLWMSVGGVLGGLFNALLAPQLFNSIAEYPVVIVLAALLATPRLGDERDDRRQRMVDLAVPVALGVVTIALVLLVQQTDLAASPPGLVVCFGLPTFASFFCSRRPVRFGLALAVVLAASMLYGEQQDQLHAERSFFGLHRVSYDAATDRHHGNTLHGQQSLDPRLRQIPMAYYHPGGPIGEVFRVYGGRPGLRVGAVGLGAGALAAYARAGQEWTFYEIDPVVARIASDPRYFTFLQDSPVPVAIRLGDARLTLGDAPDAAYDIIALDAYSSDAIPVHLATREAVALYVRKLAPDGLLAFHLSNQHLDLVPLLGAIARSLDLACYERHDQSVTDRERIEGKEPSRWLVMARNEAALEPLLAGNNWWPARVPDGTPVWTDEHSSILQALGE